MVIKPEPPEALPGFQHMKRYWDNELKSYVVKISPGEFYVTNKEEVIATTLGSCISACIHDLENHVGGMNHFLLPIQSHAAKVDAQHHPRDILADATRYGNWAMEYLINEILKHGGKRENLEVKIFGGGQVLRNMAAIGDSNINFTLQYISNEHLRLTGQDVGDNFPRKVLYYPQTGVVRVKRLQSFIDNSIFLQEQEYLKNVKSKPVAGKTELF